MARSRYQVLGTTPHFVTCSVVEWIPLFSQPELVAIVLDALRFLQQEQRLTLHSYVVMENHLHLVASAADLSKEMGNFKSFTARSMIDYLQQHRPQSYWLKRLAAAKLSHKTGQRYQVRQEGFHPQLIMSEAMLQQTVDYIHQNPVPPPRAEALPLGSGMAAEPPGDAPSGRLGASQFLSCVPVSA
jgi:putative transposase